MKKIILSFSFLFLFALNAFSQEINKKLINDNLDELFINKDNPFGAIPEKTVNKYLSESLKIYFFEIVYNNKILFRETITKSIPQSRDSDIMSNQFRFKYSNILLDSSEISNSDQLKLLESYKNKIVEIAGKKLIYLNDYQIVEKDYNKNKYVILNPLDDMQINIYKIEFP